MENGVRPVVKRHQFDPPPTIPASAPLSTYIFQRITPESLTFCAVHYAETIYRYKYSVSHRSTSVNLYLC